jgi:2-isopropylmalate synthase
MEPMSVGVPESKLVLGKHSGRHALAKRCEDLGCPLTREQLDVMYTRFTALADRKKGLRNDEIAGLAREIVAESKSSGVAVS